MIKEKYKGLPGTPITKKEKEIKLLEYNDIDFSMKEEQQFYQKEELTYFARMDTETNYNNKNYYNRFYISKDEVVEKNEKGVYSSGVYITPFELESMGKSSLITIEENSKSILKEYGDGTILIHWTAPIADLYYDKRNNIKKINEYVYNTLLKRTFTFNPLRFYNSYIAENEFYKDGTVDEFLIKVLLEKKIQMI